MRKIVWCMWFQGRDPAPQLVRKCLASWEQKNPGWDVRCLDAHDLATYVPIGDYVDLGRQQVTHASLSDIARMLLLHEYGGIWVDATTLCNRPLDDWLPSLMGEGFFAFDTPAPGRPLASWFLAAVPGNAILARWCAKTLRYWQGRMAADRYFWLHDQFKALLEEDSAVAASWSRVPKMSADAPHAIQRLGMSRPADEVTHAVDWSTPVFKLTHRAPASAHAAGTLLSHVLEAVPVADAADQSEQQTRAQAERPLPTFAALKVSTDNLGDHMQIIASDQLLRRFGVTPQRRIDRDDEIRSAPAIADLAGPVPIHMNGWFKRNADEWPPNEHLLPLFQGFHIRLFQCPALTTPASLDYLRRHAPIGCRDIYTCKLLTRLGVEAYVSNCLSLSFPKRPPGDHAAGQILVVSRDQRLLDALPPERGPYTFVCHYTGSSDFEHNMRLAQDYLRFYRSGARLIITSLLHCALPAIAMGIPVIVFYPINDATGHASDRERFSSLSRMLRVYQVSEMSEVDWSPQPIDVGDIKLGLRDTMVAFLARIGVPRPHPIGPFAPPSALPPP
jgi:hypothetical protein